VWRIELNQTKLFFDVIISHLLLQVVPEKFQIHVDSYSDLTEFIVQQIDLIIEFTLNEILALGRYEIASVLQNILNQPFFTSKSFIPIDDYIPYNIIDKEPASFFIKAWSDHVPVIQDTYFSLFMNATLFPYHGDPKDYLEAERQLKALNLP